jgi:cystathionine beta-lyase family protein involved in aluminum resistance
VFLTGKLTREAIAKALIYPRILGTSITTSFGTNIQGFISDVLADAFGSTTPGIDIEFTDCVDGRRKLCQVKLGPTTINNDDVETVHAHFADARGRARLNKSSVRRQDFVVGVVYGEKHQLSANYKALQNVHEYDVFVGEDFWHRLTGSKLFYRDLIEAIASVAEDVDASDQVIAVIDQVASSTLVKGLAQDT